MRTVLLCLLLALVPAALVAQTVVVERKHEAPASQDLTAWNSIYLDLGGPGLLWSINYDRMLANNVSARIGVGHLAVGTNDNQNYNSGGETLGLSATTFPIMVNWYPTSERSSHKFELGLGVVIITARVDFLGSSGTGSGMMETATIGYRYQPLDGGILFRIGFTPLLIGNNFLPWAGLSCGVAF